MGRRTQTLELIQDDRKRSAIYRRRKECLKKKARQLSVLCDRPTAVICFDPAASGRVTAWPEDEAALREVVDMYMSTPEEKRRQCEVGLADVLAKKQQLRKKQSAAELGKRPAAGLDLDGMSEEELRRMARSLDTSLEVYRERIRRLKDQDKSRRGEHIAPPSAAAALQQPGVLVGHLGHTPAVFDPWDATCGGPLEYPDLANLNWGQAEHEFTNLIASANNAMAATHGYMELLAGASTTPVGDMRMMGLGGGEGLSYASVAPLQRYCSSYYDPLEALKHGVMAAGIAADHDPVSSSKGTWPMA